MVKVGEGGGETKEIEKKGEETEEEIKKKG